MNRRAMRKPSLITGAAASLLAVVALSGCHKKPLGPPWVQLDLTQEKPFVELTPPGISEAQVYQQRVGHLGATEVRDLSKVPQDQQATFPSSAGEIHVVEQIAGSRLKWRVHVDDGSYVSFTPVGFEKPCDACKYRMGVRTSSGVEVLWESMAQPVGPAAPKAVEVDLSKYADSDLDLLFQIEGPAPAAPGQLTPSVVWGSLALYSRQPQHTSFKPDRPNILLVGIDTLRADRLGPWGRRPSLTPTLDQLAAEGDVWTSAFSTFNVTNPSFVSIMTGLYGKNHGVYDLHTRLPAGFTTLARRLADAGYQTLAVIAARHLGDHNSGLGQGFAEVMRSDEHYAAELGVDKTLAWLAAHCTRPHPFFVWLHVFPTPKASGPPIPWVLARSPPGSPSAPPVPAPTTSPSLPATATFMTVRSPTSIASSAAFSVPWPAAGSSTTPWSPSSPITARTSASTASSTATSASTTPPLTSPWSSAGPVLQPPAGRPTAVTAATATTASFKPSTFFPRSWLPPAFQHLTRTASTSAASPAPVAAAPSSPSTPTTLVPWSEPAITTTS
jgi:hypothetical protein